VNALNSAVRTDLFRYDASSPLRFAVIEQEPQGEAMLARVRYDNGVGGLVSALAVRPTRASKRRGAAGVLLAHGGFEAGKHLFLDQALELGPASRGHSDSPFIVALPAFFATIVSPGS
jgi:hypothetical protein